MKKRCCKCGIIKDVSEFHLDKGRKDEKQPRCKECHKKYYKNNKEKIGQYHKKYRKVNKEKIKEKDKAYRENNRERSRQYNKKYREKNKEKINQHKKEYRKANKEKRNQHDREYRKANKEKERLYYKEYRKANKEKINQCNREYFKTPKGKIARKRGDHKRRACIKNTEVTLTVEEWEYILEKQKNRCNICGNKFTVKNQPTQDHILPLKHNGDYSSDNIQALCSSCNSSKNAKLDKQFIQTWTLV